MSSSQAADSRPNIVFVLGEDWGRYASAYAGHEGSCALHEQVRTPNFDRLAKEGVLFTGARTPAPGCNPCRSSLMSGRYFWQTGLGAIEQGTKWDTTIPTWPLELEQHGYFLGHTYEGDFGKTNAPIGGERTAFHPAGKHFGDFSRWVTKNASAMGSVDAAKNALLAEVRGNFTAFLDAAADRPFCYLWGPTTTHRGAGWAPGSGKALWDIDPDRLKGGLPGFLPDVPEIREDLSDYLGECCALDAGLGVLLAELDARGLSSGTLVVVTGDHGIPGMPRSKATLYDFGCQVPLAIRWRGSIPGGRVVQDLVNTMDLAPTLCEVALRSVPHSMTARSLLPLLLTEKQGQVEAARSFVVSGLERHVSIAREDFLGYPCRSLRTRSFLYIVNFAPQRWPAGSPHGLEEPRCKVHKVPADVKLATDTMLVYPDFDGSPTKAWMIHHRGDPAVAPLFGLAVGKRPARELYDVARDPDSLRNLADDPDYAQVVEKLDQQLKTVLTAHNDPRLVEHPCRYELEPYAGIIAKYTDEKGRQLIAGLEKTRLSWRGGGGASSSKL
eukprot:TRINITY_DN93573_c0_g1_i1.p1 TRINITY_DN93573_c0_g1~~TRINITY_DN93573_c0_g1_i1.p1  ORF type:complete len:555 (-),score=112.08 TRINITY_DN93573_c0_g1_i1:191-1855(-)